VVTARTVLEQCSHRTGDRGEVKNGAPTGSSASTQLNRLGEYTVGGDRVAVARNWLCWSEIGGAFRDPRGSHTLGNLPHNQEAILDQEAGSHRILGSHTIRNQE
jgi:hypothetical protein